MDETTITERTGLAESTPVAVDWSRPTQPVEIAGAVLGIGRSSAYKGVASGDIPHIRIGSRIVVPTAALRRMVGLDQND